MSLTILPATCIGAPPHVPRQLVEDVQHEDAAESEPAPLVAAGFDSAEESDQDHEGVRNNNGTGCELRNVCQEDEVQQQQGGGEEPVHVARPEDLARQAGLLVHVDLGGATLRGLQRKRGQE